jgi:Calx-beta domain-containing protein/lecithin:cholesterol acyltransferase
MTTNGRVVVSCTHGERDPDRAVVAYRTSGAALDQGNEVATWPSSERARRNGWCGPGSVASRGRLTISANHFTLHDARLGSFQIRQGQTPRGVGKHPTRARRRPYGRSVRRVRHLVWLAAIVIGGLLAAPAHADVFTFTGESVVDAANWNDGRNWRRTDGSHGVPGGGDDAIIPGGIAGPNLSSGAGAARRISLAGNLQVTGRATLTVGSGPSSFAGNVSVSGGGTLVLNGAVTWSGGNWNIGGVDGGTLENRGRLSIAGNVSSGCPSPCGGVLRNTVGATIDSRGASPLLSTPFVNHGTLSVGAGELFLQGLADEPSGGRFTIADGAVLQTGGAGLPNAFRLGSTAHVTGPGTLRLHSSAFEFVDGIGPGGAYSVGTTQISSAPGLGGGVLDLGGGTGTTGRLTSGGSGGGVSDAVLRVGGGESELDRVTFDEAASVSFDPQATIELGSMTVRGGATLTLDGDAAWSTGIWNVGGTGGGTVENGGRLAITGNVIAGCPGSCGASVHNLSEGTIEAHGTPTLGLPLVNEGTLAVEDGTLTTNAVEQRAGEITVAFGATFGGPSGSIAIDGGSVSGDGTVRSPTVTNNGGTVRPGVPGSPGELRIDGSYTQRPGGTLAVDVAGVVPGAGFDRLAVTGRAALDGTLAIATAPDFFPARGSSFRVLTGAPRAGTFPSVRGAEARGWQVGYGDTFVTLTTGPGLSIGDASLRELDADTAVGIPVTLSAASRETVTVDFATRDILAQAPGDYAPASGTLTFVPGDTREVVTVRVRGDQAVEDDEDFGVSLRNPSFATIATQHGSVTITDDDEPVIFIPGFLGSHIECRGEIVFTRLLLMRLADDGINDLAGPCRVLDGARGLVQTVLGKDIYRSAVAFLERAGAGGVHFFPWDWRKSPEQSLARLDDFVDQVTPPGRKAVLMAHSMGGLLTRWYIDDPGRARKIARAVTIGTPYWGAPKALFPLAAGVETPLEEGDELDALFDNAELMQLARNLQGLYFLWPSAAFGGWLSVGEGNSPLGEDQLLAFVDQLRGNSALLKHALAQHEQHLDEFNRNGVDYHVLVGTGMLTMRRVRDISTLTRESVYRIGWADGDGTVPRRSALLDGKVPADRLHFVCRVPHVELPGSPVVTDRLGAFLFEGKPIGVPDSDCAAEGLEIETVRTVPAVASSAASGPLTLAAAQRAGLVDVLDLGLQRLLVTNRARPVTLRVRGRRLALRVTPLRNGRRGEARYYGPVSGRLTIRAAAGAVIRKGGKRVGARRRADRRPPRTRVRVITRGRRALLRFRARDRSGVAATYVKIGTRPARRVRRGLRVARKDLRRLRYQSIDVFANIERPRHVTIRP